MSIVGLFDRASIVERFELGVERSPGVREERAHRPDMDPVDRQREGLRPIMKRRLVCEVPVAAVSGS